MQIYLGYLSKVKDNIFSVGLVHYKPFDENYGLGKSKNELMKDGLLVDRVPEPEIRPGYESQLHINLTTNEMWYEYYAVEEPDKNRVSELEEKINQMNDELIELSNAFAVQLQKNIQIEKGLTRFEILSQEQD